MHLASDLSLIHPAADPALWHIDPAITYLNHGAFGACPKAVLAHQQEIRERLERDPIQFFVRDLESLLDEARSAVADFVGADSEDLVFVPNATAGINSVLRSLRFGPGDQFVVSNHEYNASHNALRFAAEQHGAEILVAEVPYPVGSSEQIVAAYLERVTDRTKLILLDHVTSQTGLVFPIREIVHALNQRGIDSLVDGAHAPGMIPLNLRDLGATYYSGNCHKWMCAPKGAGFLYVRRDRQSNIRPLIISHGANSRRTDRSRFLIEFGWTGTGDVSAYLSVPAAIAYLSGLLPGGWEMVRQRNHALVVAGREILLKSLGVEAPCPDSLLGTLATIPLPDSASDGVQKSPLYLDELQELLFAQEQIEVPVIPWPAAPRRLLRISAQLYNYLGQYEVLSNALTRFLR